MKIFLLVLLVATTALAEETKDIEIESKRIGDVIGIHELDVKTNYEKIHISHESLNRNLFAEGAIWASKYLIENNLSSGLHWFEEIVKKKLEA